MADFTAIDRLLTVREALDILRISRTTFYEITTSGALATVRVAPRTVRISEADLARYIEAQTQRARTAPAAAAAPACRRVAKRVLTPRTAAPQPSAG